MKIQSLNRGDRFARLQKTGGDIALVRVARRTGYALIEIIITVTIFTVVMLSAISMIESGQKFSAATFEAVNVQDLAQQMLFRFGHELSNASVRQLPRADLANPLLAGTTNTISVTSTLPFPPQGTLVISPRTANEERVSYVAFANQNTFTTLTRGQACTTAVDHLDGAGVEWAGLAVPSADQDAPPATEFDGIALEDGVQVFFQGSGAGFSYRVPVDPTGGNNVMEGDDLHWGATTPISGPTEDGWMALYYEPKTEYDESVERHDLNGDGDELDVFDIGQIRRTSWDTTDPTREEDVAMGPSAVLQERCNWGGDLDNDGFDDPIFLWDPATRLLHIRLWVMGTAREAPIVRLVETVTFLRNEPEM